MSTSIEWIIEYMNVSSQPIAGETEVVVTAGWKCIATQLVPIPNPWQDGPTEHTYTSLNYGACSFTEPSKGGSFTPYAQLTQDQVLGWCWANGVDKEATEASVQAAINNQINPPVVQPPLPWSTGEQ
jgi:hypothetical protein